MDVTPLRILLCFVAALLTTVAVRFALGSRRDQWFRRSASKSFLTFRPPLSAELALGYPVCPAGYAVWCGLLALIAAEAALILMW